MRHVILDLNAIIGLQTPGASPFSQVIEDSNVALYVLDAVLFEAVRRRTTDGERVLAALLPYVDRVFAGPAHSEVIRYEMRKLRPMSKNRMRRNGRTEWLRGIIQESADGDMPLQRAWGESVQDRDFQKMLSAFGMTMQHYYNAAHTAWVETDRLFGLNGRHSLLSANRQGRTIKAFMLDNCIRHALGSMHVDIRRGEGDVRIYHALVRQQSYEFIRSLAHWIRAYQQARDNRMINWQRINSSEIVNEFFDVVGVSFLPYFDEYLTGDQASLQTMQLLNEALGMFRENHHVYLNRIRDIDTTRKTYNTASSIRRLSRHGLVSFTEESHS